MKPFLDLPELLVEIAEVAGLSAALAIAQFKGGTRTHFPAKASDDHWMPVLIGREAADKLCKHFRVNHKGGISLLVPLGPTKLYDVARLRVRALRAEGHSIAVTARMVGVSTRAVEKWTSQERQTQRRKATQRPDAQGRTPSRPDATPNGLTIADGPDLLIEIAEIAGTAAALAVSEAKAGRAGDFRADAPAGHWLVEAVGRRTAEALRAHVARTYGADVLLIVPQAQPFLHALVQRRAVVMREEGASAEEVARAMSVTPAHIERWCAAERTKQARRMADAAVRNHDGED